MNASHAAHTCLDGRVLGGARLAWLAIVVLSCCLFVAAIPARAHFLFTNCAQAKCIPGQLSGAGVSALQQLGLSREFYAAYILLMEAGFPLVFSLVGAFIFWRKSDDWVALLVSGSLIVLGTSIGANFDALARMGPVWQWLVAMIRAVGLGSFVLFFVFPNGRLAPRWTRWLLPVLLALIALAPFAPFAYPSLPALMLIAAWLFAGALLQAYRYRRVYTAIERQQTKWVIYAFALTLAGFVVGFLLPPVLVPGQIGAPNEAVHSVLGLLYVMIAIPLAFGPTMLIPVALAVSIMRYRLWDIDLIIRRTLIYSALTVSLALVYFGSVVLLQQLARALTGQQQSELVTVTSTLAIAALFVPLRMRIQRAIDRRFYRRKYDAAKTLEAFAARLRDDVDLDRLSEQLLEVVDMTMQPVHTSLWLRSGQAPAAPGEFGRHS